MAHTKGPWEVKEDRVITSAIDEYGRRKELLLTGVSLTAGNHPDRKEAEANARLIAESPTMFEYITKKAKEGDDEAKQIVDKVNA